MNTTFLKQAQAGYTLTFLMEGYRAFAQGVTECPYIARSPRARAWRLGWDQACIDSPGEAFPSMESFLGHVSRFL